MVIKQNFDCCVLYLFQQKAQEEIRQKHIIDYSKNYGNSRKIKKIIDNLICI
ncbi:hypothetical protein CLOSCI_03827 [[Clostridium] scindens ATCC 35704]|nr:hypothetical protein CLOSCI_03827 [[Clostridium] scindens ATCC 35704]